MPNAFSYTILSTGGIDRANDGVIILDATGPSVKRATVASVFDAGLNGAHTLTADATFTGAVNWTLTGFNELNLVADFPKIEASDSLIIRTPLVVGSGTKAGQALLTDGTTSGVAEFGDLKETALAAVTATLTAGRAITDADHGKTLLYSGSGNITVTVDDALRNDLHVRLIQMGTGKITVGATGSGVVNAPQGHLSTGYQYATIEIRSVSPLGFVVSGHTGA